VAQPGREHLFQLAKVAGVGVLRWRMARTDPASRVIAPAGPCLRRPRRSRGAYGLATTRRDEQQIRAIRRTAGRVVPARADLRERLECTRQGHRGLRHRRASFVDVVPGVRVGQAIDFVSDDPTNAGTMTMTWEVTAGDAGTRVDIRADDVPAGISAKDHAAGLASSLANLATYLQQ
jgi:Activator of Hsp90 ATPase homolog 1-like protein